MHFSRSALRVHDSQSYKKIDNTTRERYMTISFAYILRCLHLQIGLYHLYIIVSIMLLILLSACCGLCPVETRYTIFETRIYYIGVKQIGNVSSHNSSCYRHSVQQSMTVHGGLHRLHDVNVDNECDTCRITTQPLLFSTINPVYVNCGYF